MDIKTAPLGHEFSYRQLARLSNAIWGACSWPGQREGFCCVLAMDKEEHFDSYDIVVLDEYQSFDTRDLVRQCGALDARYQPDRWVGDTTDDAASRFIHQMNSEANEARRHFYVSSSLLLEMESLYAYLLAELRGLLDPERRMLFLKTSKALDYLAQIEPDEIHTLEKGAYPAIEALAIAVCEMQRYGSQLARRKRPDRWDRKPQPRSAMAG